MKNEQLNEALRGFTTVRRIEFSVDVRSGACSLILDLMKTGAGTELRESENMQAMRISLIRFFSLQNDWGIPTLPDFKAHK